MYYCRIRTLTETGNAIRNILTRNGFSLTHSISPPIFASMASVCHNRKRRCWKFIRISEVDVTNYSKTQCCVRPFFLKCTLNRVKISNSSSWWYYYDNLLRKCSLINVNFVFTSWRPWRLERCKNLVFDLKFLTFQFIRIRVHQVAIPIQWATWWMEIKWCTDHRVMLRSIKVIIIHPPNIILIICN